MKEANPQVPNVDQLQYIHPKANPRTNAARYGEPAAQELKAESPTIIIGPNATYLVQPGYWPEKAENAKPEPPEPPPEEEAPVLSSLEPNELPVWAQDTEVSFKGEGFTQESVIVWNNGDEVTQFVSATELKTLVKPSTVQVPPPFALPVCVRNGELKSNEVTFTFIA